MDPQLHAILMTKDPATLTSVAAALKSAKKPVALETCASLPGLVAQLQNASPGFALIDVDPEPKRILAELDPITSRFAQTRFVTMATDVTTDLMMDAMQIGARHLLRKDSIASDLLDVLSRFEFGEAPGSGPQGLVVTVLSAGGGCGATTLALNIAYEFQLQASRPVLLADLDDRYGAIAAYLDREGEYGIADVLAHQLIDEELIRTTSLTFSDRLHVLLSPASVRSSRNKPMEFESINEFLGVCERSYACTVLDAPRLAPKVAVRLAKASSKTFLMLQLCVTNIRSARAQLDSLTEQGIAPESVTVVIGRYDRPATISISQAREALGRETLVVVGSDFRAANESMTNGQPLAVTSPRSTLRKEVRQLAMGILALHGVSA